MRVGKGNDRGNKEKVCQTRSMCRIDRGFWEDLEDKRGILTSRKKGLKMGIQQGHKGKM